jgi:hypothetical protein
MATIELTAAVTGVMAVTSVIPVTVMKAVMELLRVTEVMAGNIEGIEKESGAGVTTDDRDFGLN